MDADYLSGLTGEQSLHRRENGFIHMLQLHTIICMRRELELENEKKLEQGTVTIGVSEIALHLLLLPVLGEFRRKYPKIRLRISSYTAPQAIQTVRNGLSDFAVASTPAEVKKAFKGNSASFI